MKIKMWHNFVKDIPSILKQENYELESSEQLDNGVKTWHSSGNGRQFYFFNQFNAKFDRWIWSNLNLELKFIILVMIQLSMPNSKFIWVCIRFIRSAKVWQPCFMLKKVTLLRTVYGKEIGCAKERSLAQKIYWAKKCYLAEIWPILNG